jgi:deoxyadenosine/deoxycytidine kinase
MSNKINIAVIGTIGVGKSTFINRLNKIFEDESFPFQSVVVSEPSVSIDFLKDTLKRFYKDTKTWAYPLQLGVSAAHEIHFEQLRQGDYNIALFDAPYSSFVYCSIHLKAGRLTKQEFDNIINVARPFPFHHVIVLNETADTTINRIMKRNRSIEMTDLLYLHEHISDYQIFKDDYIKRYFPDANIISVDTIPDDTSDEYWKLLDSIYDQIMVGKEKQDE